VPGSGHPAPNTAAGSSSRVRRQPAWRCRSDSSSRRDVLRRLPGRDRLVDRPRRAGGCRGPGRRPLHHEAIVPGGPGHFGVIFMPGSYRRTKADTGRVIAELEAMLAKYPGERDLENGVRPAAGAHPGGAAHAGDRRGRAQPSRAGRPGRGDRHLPGVGRHRGRVQHAARGDLARPGAAARRPLGEIGRLLQPFQRLATTRSSDGDGHGLGLPIVRAIATAHGATLTTRARAEGGLHVEVSFPADGDAIAWREPRDAEVGAGVMGL
jgi:hypothetical protein